MNDDILNHLASKWEYDAIAPEIVDGSEEAKLHNAMMDGERNAKKECAETLRTLLRIFKLQRS